MLKQAETPSNRDSACFFTELFLNQHIFFEENTPFYVHYFAKR